MSQDQTGHRVLLVGAAKALLDEATAGARASSARSPSWHFYHGVEAAAEHVLRPELAAVREDSSWLSHEEPSFRNGFLEASTVLANAAMAPTPPARVRLPVPPTDDPSEAAGR